MQNRIISEPNQKQRLFFKSGARFTAYGGARGGGKSWALRKKAMLLCINYCGIKVLMLRRTYPELRENHILPLMADLQGVAEYKETQKTFVFKNGSRLRFGYCDTEIDVLQYQGQEFDIICIDEATQFSRFQFDTLTACIRGVNAFPKRMYLTCNPGGVGHDWVKRLFIDKIYTRAQNPKDYVFIPARVYDNEALLKMDAGYVDMLKNLPADLRRAWLDGDWNIFCGQYFTEFRTDVHVISPFEIPSHWRRYRALDYGLDMLACYWIAVDTHNRAYVYKELYKPGLIVSAAAGEINDMTNEQIYQTIAPPDLKNRQKDTGKSIAELFYENGISFVFADNDRVMGWYNLKEWLKPFKSETGELCANLRIFENCVNLIRCLPMLQFDKKDANDVSITPHEITHAPDAIRYFCSGRPVKSPPKNDGLKYNFECERPRGGPLGQGRAQSVI